MPQIETRPAPLMRRAAALALFAWALWQAWTFPVFALPLTAGLALYGLILAREVRVWLLVLPPAVAALSLGLWSGRYLWGELDLLLTVTVAGGLWATTPWWPRRPLRLLWPIGLFALVQIGLTVRGLLPLDPAVFDTAFDYFSPLNALRELKGLFWALLLLPMLLQAQRRGDPGRWLVGGMMLGLAALIAMVLWERKLFTGILNFDTAYRVSGPFFDLHTGGAAIDAYLTLAFPFAFGTLLLWHRTDLRVLGAVLTALGAYALFVTYSRADYAAIAVMLLMFGIGLAVTTGAGTRLVRRRAAATVAASLLLLALLPLFVGGTMERRFQAVGVDLGTRLQHWRAALALNDAVPQGALLGIGKGVFPRLYYLDQSLRGEQLATLQHLREGREDFIRFSPSGPSGVVYLQQRLAPNEPGSYRIQGRIRTRHGQDERLLLEFCERHILRFAEECQWTRLLVADTRGEWVEFNQPVSLDQLLRSGRVWQRPVDLAVLNRGLQHGLDVAALQLYSPAGEPLLANSDFAAGWDHWFFSDGNHTRWHVKNLFLFSYIEGGWLGLIVLLVFLGAVFARLWRLATHGDPLGMLLAAALAGTLTLGLFDSLFDVPRIALSFLTLAFAGLVLEPVPGRLQLAHIALPPWARRLRPRWVLALSALALAALLGARLLRSDYSLAQWLQMAADRVGLGDSRLTALLLPTPRGQLAAAELQLRPHGPRIWFKELADLDAAGRRAHWNARQAEYARRGIPGFDACQAKGLLPDAGCWFVTGDVAAGERALTALRELPSTAPQASGEYGNGLELALAYDLLDGLPARQGEVATALQQRLRAQLRGYLLLLDSDGAAVWHGRSTLAAHAMLLAAVLPGTADDLALVGRAAFHFLQTIDAVALVEAWPEGYNYWINSRAFPLLLASSAYLNAFDQPPRAAAVRRVVERLGEWHIQQVRPDLVATQIGDEGPRIDLRHDTRRVIDLIAQITGRALFADFSRVLAARDANRGYYADYQWAFPLLNDPSLDSGTATAANLESFATQLPTADWFGPGAMNQFYVRSGWDRDATFISFRAGHSLSHHGHYDAGHFTLFKGVPLAVTGASYRGQIDAGHRLGYAIRTVSKNSLLIMRPGEQVQPNHFFKNNLADGGQRLTQPTGVHLPSVEHWRAQLGQGQHLEGGRIRGFEHQPGAYTLIDADLTDAYNTPSHDEGGTGGKVHQVLRQLLYLHDRDQLLIHDRIAVVDPEFQARWLLQTKVRPAAPGLAPIRGDLDNGILYSDAGELRISDGRGRLKVSALLPAQRQLTLYGGPDYRFYVDRDGDPGTFDGQNQGHNSRITDWYDLALWRTEIGAAAPATVQRFLNVLSPSLDAYSDTEPRLWPTGTEAAHAVLLDELLVVFVDADLRPPLRLELPPQARALRLIGLPKAASIRVTADAVTATHPSTAAGVLTLDLPEQRTIAVDWAPGGAGLTAP